MSTDSSDEGWGAEVAGRYEGAAWSQKLTTTVIYLLIKNLYWVWVLGNFPTGNGTIVSGLDKVTCVFVNFTSGDSDKDLSDCLDKVFGKLAKVGLTLNMEKCCFLG